MIDKLDTPKDGDVDPKLGDQIPTNYITQAIAELKNGYRLVSTLRNGEPFTVKITHPSLGQEMKLSHIYTEKYNELMSSKGYRTHNQLEKELKERGVINAYDDKKLEELQKALTSCLEQYNLALVENPKSDSLKELRATYYSTRDKIFEIHSNRTSHYVNCIENVCEQWQNFHKMVFCILTEDDKPVWASIDELMSETDRPFLSDLITESQMFWSGLSKEVLDLPRVLDEIRGASLETSLETIGQ